MFSQLRKQIDGLDVSSITQERAILLDGFASYIQGLIKHKKPLQFNFICTHNSRRSHFAQIWFQAMACYYRIQEFNCYSGGTESTAVYPEVINTLKTMGFEIEFKEKKEVNSHYHIAYSEKEAPITGFSKKYDHPFNPSKDFVAIMTCGHADENCPMILGADKRIALTYDDPKISDGTAQEQKTYYDRSLQIATEAKYMLSKIKL
jgi:arsenate reductase